jgi:hypothetical protein
VRFGYVFGGLAQFQGSASLILPQLATHTELRRVADLFEAEWAKLVGYQARGRNDTISSSLEVSESSIVEPLAKSMESRMVELLCGDDAPLTIRLPTSTGADALRCAVVESVRAFFYQDLLKAAFALLKGAEGEQLRKPTHAPLTCPLSAMSCNARHSTRASHAPPAHTCVSRAGSFGLVLSHSLDADHEMVIAARGQTMSVSFYPSSGLVAFGSEASATKAPMQAGEKDSFRFDLDDVTGELLLLQWDQVAATVGSPRAGQPHMLGGAVERVGTEIFRYGPNSTTLLVGTNYLEDGSSRPFWDRRLQLGGNPLVTPLNDVISPDPIGRDLLEIPAVMRAIEADWSKGPESFNRITAWNLASKLRERLNLHSAASQGEAPQHDGSVDLLLTGCEVSLWLAEQFAADLHLVFPKLKIVTISANKLLGQLGQQHPMPQCGFSFNQQTYSLRDSIVLTLSHSGGTFGSLACCNLLRGWTPHIFTITSEFDTQVARAVRGGIELESQFVFSTFAGFRPSEPCSLSVVAMHHLLSHLLIFFMGYTAHLDGRDKWGASNFVMQEVKELEALKRGQADAIQEIVGSARLGDTPTSAQLRAQGTVWGQHVLEGPISWLMSLAYIAATVLTHQTPLGTIAKAALGHDLPTLAQSNKAPATETVLAYAVGVIDVIICAPPRVCRA